ncbi:hypothetical protein EYF80_034613 [Liparis tanakae]|uniref:Uncharacterized protein n=1 Tax=Liparis tanakae TaxID=230148 RepID=A0A4Z2GNF4_9TELE|nr:hypothetical protein EYF80_034613 [Liparis tanakae]
MQQGRCRTLPRTLIMVLLKTTLTTVTLKGKAGSPAERRLNASPKAQKEYVRGDTTDASTRNTGCSSELLQLALGLNLRLDFLSGSLWLCSSPIQSKRGGGGEIVGCNRNFTEFLNNTFSRNISLWFSRSGPTGLLRVVLCVNLYMRVNVSSAVRRWSLSESIQVTVRQRGREGEGVKQKTGVNAPGSHREETGTRVGNSNNKRSNGVKRSGEQR